MVTLVIMDGLGINKSKYGNAVKLQGTPYLNKLKKMFFYTELNASGRAVGLNDGIMGNSEVGHLNLGAGRVVYQDLLKIDNSIASGDFFNNETIKRTLKHAIQNNSALHIMGLCSDGAVHSHISHLFALIDMAEASPLKEIYLHLFLDGRDTPFDSGIKYVEQVEKYIANKKTKVASLCGRVYAMDRENRYDRVEKAYKMLTGSQNNQPKTINDAFFDSYGNNVYDEFFEPVQLYDFKPVKDGDSVIFFNYRTDRARELTRAFTGNDFKEFERRKLENICFTSFTEYDSAFKNVNVVFPPEKINDNISAILSSNDLKQFHISETTKYAHVTFFFNGGIEQPYNGEERKLIESENVLSFATTPKMKAYEITDEVLMAITEKKYDFILVNLSNADMIGHTGDLDAGIKAVEAVDKCAYAIALATLTAGGDCIITADHGNVEEMLDKSGKKLTSHTTNMVPFILASEKFKNIKFIKDGKLANVAPTVLKLLNLNIPSNMEKPLF